MEWPFEHRMLKSMVFRWIQYLGIQYTDGYWIKSRREIKVSREPFFLLQPQINKLAYHRCLCCLPAETFLLVDNSTDVNWDGCTTGFINKVGCSTGFKGMGGRGRWKTWLGRCWNCCCCWNVGTEKNASHGKLVFDIFRKRGGPSAVQ